MGLSDWRGMVGCTGLTGLTELNGLAWSSELRATVQSDLDLVRRRKAAESINLR